MKYFFRKNYGLLLLRLAKTGSQSIFGFIDFKSRVNKEYCGLSILSSKSTRRFSDRRRYYFKADLFKFCLYFVLLFGKNCDACRLVTEVNIKQGSSQKLLQIIVFPSIFLNLFVEVYALFSYKRIHFFLMRQLLFFFALYFSFRYVHLYTVSGVYDFVFLENMLDLILQDLSFVHSSIYTGNFVLNHYSSFFSEFGEVFSVNLKKRSARYTYRIFRDVASSCSVEAVISLLCDNFSFYDDFFLFTGSIKSLHVN